MVNTTRTSRRQLLQTAALAAPGIALGGKKMNAQEATADAPTPVTDVEPEVGRAEAPAWTFVVVTLQDPYPGEVPQPPEPEP